MELLYSHVKMRKMETGQQKVFEDGANSAYANKGLKTAMASTPGAGSAKKGPVAAKDLAGIPNSDYIKRRQEILEAHGVKF